MKLSKEQLADLINNRLRREEITDDEEILAKENGLVVIFGSSDDLVEFRGVINDEIGAFEGTDFIIAVPGQEIPIDEDEEIFRRAKEYKPITIEYSDKLMKNKFSAVWNEDNESVWEIKSDIPHASFYLYDDDEKFCKGMVISIYDLQK